jgi:hypothetical protein
MKDIKPLTGRKIKEFSKSMFLQVDAEGRKKYTWNEISKAVQKKFHKSVHFTTIQKWCKKENWEDVFDRLKMAGIEQAEKDIQSKENAIIDERSQTIADIYKSNKQIQGIAQKTILARMTGQQLFDKEQNPIVTQVQTPDIIRLLQHSEEILLELHDKKKKDDSDAGGSNTTINFIVSEKQKHV